MHLNACKMSFRSRSRHSGGLIRSCRSETPTIPSSFHRQGQCIEAGWGVLAVSEAAQPETAEAVLLVSASASSVQYCLAQLDLRLFAWLYLLVTLPASVCEQQTDILALWHIVHLRTCTYLSFGTEGTCTYLPSGTEGTCT